MAGSKVFVSVLVCLVAVCCHGDSDQNKVPPKRFILDTFLGPFNAAGSAVAGAATAVFKGECLLCKCNNSCTGEATRQKYFGIKTNETQICGKNVWDSINCTDRHNFISTASPPTNVPQANVQTSCNKLCSISTVANLRPMTHPNASMCLNGKHESNEALPMQCCHISTPNTWKQGQQLMPLCLSIPHYTPVAAFINGNYIPESAGIFSSCLSNGEIGFQMIRQDCGYAPELLHVSTNQTRNNHPNVYYVIH